MTPLDQHHDRAESVPTHAASSSLLRHLKNKVIAPGSRSRLIQAGPLKGLRMRLDLGHQTQVYLGLYERELHPWLALLGRNALTAIDVGAADGAYSLYFLKRTAAQSVYSFEPDAVVRELFRLNLRLNGVNDDERIRLFDATAGSGQTGNSVALDSLYSGISWPCLVKVDVEGAEVDVLTGAARLLRHGGASWIIETHSAELERDCVRLLADRGLTVIVVSPAWWRFAVPEARPIAHNRWLIAYDKGAFTPR